MPDTAAVDYRQLPAYRPLFLDYLDRFEALSPFFSANPYDADSWASVAAALDARAHPQRAEVARALEGLNRGLEADEAARSSLEALGAGALAVVTGQQVGLFGGPLYTLYKALSAVRLARWASGILGRKVVPLFWMDADDHDFAEVQNTFLLDSNHELVALRYPSTDSEERLPVGARKLEAAIEDVVGEVQKALPESEYKADIVASLGACYAPGRTLSQAFGSWLLKMTRGTGLALVDPTLIELKAMGRDLFEREISGGSASTELVRETTEELLARGYHAQANPVDSQLNLFYANPHRYPVSFGDGVSQKQWLQRVRDEPQCFSPNVLLRPIYQDTLLPTIAYVAGPNELAYFAQIARLYGHFGVTMPLVAPRSSFTVIERREARFLERYHVELARLKSDDESLLNEIVRAHTPKELEEDLARARTCIQEITKALARDLEPVDPTLVAAVKSTRGKLLHHIQDLESKALRAVKRRNDTLRQQFYGTRSAIFPGFEMQERKLSPVGFMSKHGWHFSRVVEEAVDPALKAHAMLYL